MKVKKIITLISLILFSFPSFATHIMGGEITWRCSGNNYIFRVKIYRDCNGATSVASDLNSNVPGLANIGLNLISQTDISPTGSPTSGTVPCRTCSQGNLGNPIPGLVEEFIYESAPINIAGTPPAGGYVFWWSLCCRSTLLTNIQNPANLGTSLRAKMYNYPGYTPGQCKDQSPYFAEKPSTIICTGYEFRYNHNAIDPELDSLRYSWDIALDDDISGGSGPVTPVPFTPGYSVTSPLPSTLQNANNIAATINAVSGEVMFKSFTQGYFVTVVKCQAYKCGVLVAEVFREINVVLVGGCSIPGAPPTQNSPPAVSIVNRKTGLVLPSNSFTVYAGDTVKLSINAVDPDPDPGAGVQIVKFEATGSELSATYTNPNAGCIITPCAYTSAPLPLTAPFGVALLFDWTTKCRHMGLDTACITVSNVYNFVVKVSDNFCPAPGTTSNTISITVKRPPKLLPPRLKCASVLNKNGDIELNWVPPTPRDTFGTFAQYEIWGATNLAGPYLKLDSVYGSLNEYLTTNHTITAAQQQAVFGAGVHAQNQSLYFQMYTRCGCDSDSISIGSNIARSIKLNATPGAGGVVNLSWNQVHNPLLATSSNKYWIYKEYPIGAPWILLDSTIHPTMTFTDNTTNTICDDTLTYHIVTREDSAGWNGCNSWSSYAGVRVTNGAPLATISPANPSFCAGPGNGVVLTANAGGSTYQWSGPITGSSQTLNATLPGTYTVTVTYMPGGCTSDTSITVVQNAVPTANLAGSTSICAGQNTNIAINFTGTGPWTYSYNGPSGVVGPLNTAVTPVNINVAPASTFNYTLVGVSNAACPGNVAGNANIVVNTIPQATIAGSTAICNGQAANIQIAFSNAPGPWTYSYNTPSGPVGPLNTATTPVNIPVSPTSTFNYTLINTNNVNCPGTIAGNANVVVNQLPLGTISVTGNPAICNGQATNIQIAFTNAPGPWTYSYNSPSGPVGPLNAATSPVNIPVSPTANFNYTMIGASNASCTGTIAGTANIVVNPLPTATIVGNPVICNGQQANLAVNFAGAPGPYSFTYNPGNVTVNGATNPAVVTVNPSSTTNYALASVTNGICAGNIIGGPAIVTVNPLPTAQIVGTQAICTGQPAVLNINFTGTGPWNYSYLINGVPAGPFVSVVSPAVINVSPAATTTYTLPLSVTDANCTGTSTSGNAVVTVNPLPTASIAGNAIICAGQATNLVIDFTGTPPFTYSYKDVTNNITYGPFNTGSMQVNVPVSPASTTSYQLVGPVTGAGCQGAVAATVVVVNVNQIPSASITGTTTVCDGTPANLTINFAGAAGPYTYSYTANGVPNGPFNTNLAVVNIPVTPSVNTTYAITSVSNANCPGSVTGTSAVVSVTPIPSASIAGTTAICNGLATNLNIAFTGQAPFTYSYMSGVTLNGPFTTSSNPAIISVNPTVTTTYSLTATVTGNGCTGATNGSPAQVTVHQLPSATIAGSPIICAGDQAAIQISFTGTAPFSYRYNDGTTTFGPFVASSNPEIINVSPTVTKNYRVTTVNDANCAGDTNGVATVTVNQLPTAQISGTTTICDNDQTNLTINFTGTGPFNYEYSDGQNTFGPFVSATNSATIPVSPSSTTTYSVISVDDVNCIGNVTGPAATITVNPLPSATMVGSPVICFGQNANLVVNFTGIAPYTYSYTDGQNIFGPFTTSSNPVNIPVGPATSTSYNLTATVISSSANCVGNTSGPGANVTVNQLPSASAVGNSVICNGNPSSFDITFTGAPPFTYSYSNGTTTFGPFNTNNFTETIPVSPTVTTNYTVVSVIDNNCTGNITGTPATVTVNQLPQASISGTASICENGATNLSINFTGTAPFTYSYKDVTNNITYGPFTTSNDPLIIPVSPAATTVYSVTSVSDANCNGNAATATATVTVNQLPTATMSEDPDICVGQTTYIKITFTGTGPFTYRYSDGVQTFGPFSTSNNPVSIAVSPANSKTYTPTSVSDINCSGNGLYGSSDVTVYALPTPVISGNNVICDGNSTSFDAGLYVSYLWSTSETTQAISVNTAGNYSVIVTDIHGCSNDAAQTLIVNETPVADFTNDTSLTCEAPIINFINNGIYPASSTFNWDFGDNGVSTLHSPSHLYQLPGTYPITLIITSQAGCADTLTQDVDITFYPLPVAEFKVTPKEASVFNSNVQFFDMSQNAVSWSWDFGDGVKSEEASPLHYYDELGKFVARLVVTNIAGCVSEYTQEVYITPFFVPNAFTPDGDGKNELFFDAGYIVNVTSYNMSIFNRWGQKVFENDNYKTAWKGVDKNGDPAPQGTYVYSIKVKTLTGKDYYYSGSVTLIR